VFCCVLINPMLGNRYGPGVSWCQQTTDNNLGWPDPRHGSLEEYEVWEVTCLV